MSQKDKQAELESMLSKPLDSTRPQPQKTSSDEFEEAIIAAKKRKLLNPNLSEQKRKDDELQKAIENAPLRFRPRTPHEEIMRTPTSQSSKKPTTEYKKPEEPVHQPETPPIKQPEPVEPYHPPTINVEIPGVFTNQPQQETPQVKPKTKKTPKKPKPITLDTIVEEKPINFPEFQGEKPELYDSGLLFKQMGISGQRKSVLRSLLSLAANEPFILVGPSGIGKTQIAKRLIKLINKVNPKLLFPFNDSKSDALLKQADKYKGKLLYFPEVQVPIRGSGKSREAFKAMFEGEPFDTLGDDGEIISVNPLSAFSAVAESDPYWTKYIASDPQFKSRANLIYLDKSRGALKNLRKARSLKRGGFDVKQQTDLNLDTLASFIGSLMDKKSKKTIDPSNAFVASYVPNIPMANRYLDHYEAIEDVIASWYKDEDTYEVGGKEIRILGLRNKYRAETLVRDDIIRALKEGYNIDYAKKVLGYSNEDIDDVNKEFEKAEEEVDWQACWESCLESLRTANAPPELISEVINRHVINGKITVHDPITGETIELAEYPRTTRQEDIVVTDLSDEFQQKAQESDDTRLELYSIEDEIIAQPENSQQKLLPAPKYKFGNSTYDSMEEAACAALMQKYIPSFEPAEGKSVHVREDMGGTIDFKVNESFVEYHPIVFFRDFEQEDFEQYQQIRADLPDEKKHGLDNECKRKLTHDYFVKRAAAINKSAENAGTELILATSPETFYDSVISRFGENIPSKEAFLHEFNEVKKIVRDANQ